jgi:hypothetical protein
MSRFSGVAGRRVVQTWRGRAGGEAAVPFLVLDLARGCDPHQARCRCCRWRSRWWTTAAQAQADHARHLAAAHGQGRPARRSRLGLMAWGWPR